MFKLKVGKILENNIMGRVKNPNLQVSWSYKYNLKKGCYKIEIYLFIFSKKATIIIQQIHQFNIQRNMANLYKILLNLREILIRKKEI